MSASSPLLQPYSLRGLAISNRVALAPMTRARAGQSRIPNAVMAEYYRQRSQAGLVITEATVIADYANGWNESPGIYTDEMQAGWVRVVDAIHSAGGKVFMQLWHCGRASHSSFTGGQLPMAPSAIAINGDYIHTPIGKQPYEVPRAITTTEIAQVVSDFGRAARRAKQAGFDGVEIHGANGYLIDSFLQSKSNHRTDEYGGSIENRYRFLAEIIDSITREFPADRVAVRISPNGVYNDMGSADFREQFVYVAQQLDRCGLAYLHVMDGLGFGFHGIGAPMTLADFRRVYHGPLMGNCGYTIDSAEAAIRDGHAEMISIGRPFISNPDFVARIRHDWPLAEPAAIADWYSPTGAKGYTDFPPYQSDGP